MQNRAPFIPQIRLYQNWLKETRGLKFAKYHDLWHWSTTDLNGFWQSIWDYFDLQSPTPHTAVLAENRMPGAIWFPGAQVNYVHQVLRHVAPADSAGMPAFISENEKGECSTLNWATLREQVATLALYLEKIGIQPGDRVAAYLPNRTETLIAFLAVVANGAVWSVCSPDMGVPAVLDRFRQIEPRVLLVCDGIRYGGRVQSRSNEILALCQGLPGLQHLIVCPSGEQFPLTPLSHPIWDQHAVWQDILTAKPSPIALSQWQPRWVPFDHPLWIVYSSGTTGLPKPIVHGHGGSVIVGLALKTLHNDVGCSYHPNSWGERYHWYSSTGWVMWNAQISGLLNGVSCVIYEGNPAGSSQSPDWSTLWRFAVKHKVTFFGAGAAFYTNCMKSGLNLSQTAGLGNIRALGTTGSPLSAEVQEWGTRQFARPQHPDIWWCNISGGTDFAGAFIGGNRELPQTPGVMQCRLMGCAVQAWDEAGISVEDSVGELVCTQPIPSMPICLWGDPNQQRYMASYFDTYPAGHGRAIDGANAPPSAGPAWRHGDWLQIKPDGSCVIYGRSDATINRHGLRLGTSEIYRAVEGIPEVIDSLVVDLEYLGKPSYMPLFVALADGVDFSPSLQDTICQAIRRELSPRFVPDAIFQVAEVPRTLSGKKQELPIKKMLLGQALDKVINRETMANPHCLDWYIEFAKKYRENMLP